jgi:hypothetical protein
MDPDPTNQTIHFTVRTMMAEKWVEFPAMKDYCMSVEEGDGPKVIWRRLASKGKSSTESDGSVIPEDMIEDEELALLEWWLSEWGEVGWRHAPTEDTIGFVECDVVPWMSLED